MGIIEDDISKGCGVSLKPSENKSASEVLKNNIMDTGIDKSLWDKFVLYGVNPTLLNNYMTLISNRENDGDDKTTKDRNCKNKDENDVEYSKIDYTIDKGDIKEKSKKDKGFDSTNNGNSYKSVSADAKKYKNINDCGEDDKRNANIEIEINWTTKDSKFEKSNDGMKEK